MPMNVKELQEQRGTLLDEAEALTVLATEENRELTAEETARIDDIIGTKERPGLAAKLDGDIQRAQRLEELTAAQAHRRGKITLEAGLGPRRKIPAQARYRYHDLKAFQGPEADEDAYATGQWILATLFRKPRAERWCNDHGYDIQAALETGDNEAGGYLVPDEMERALIKLRETRGTFRSNTRVVPMAGDTRSVGRRTAGFTTYYPDEGGSITESQPTYDQVKLVARKLAALGKYSSELSEDAIISMADELTEELGYALADAEDKAGWLGDGTSTYGGIVGVITALADGSEVTAATGNTAFSTLDLDDFENMIGKLPMYPGISPRWFIHHAGWAASMLRLQAAAGGNTIQTLGAGPAGQTFLGYPVTFVQVMNSTLTAQTSTEGLCYFGDLRMAATLGNRRGVRVMISEHRYFETDQLGIKATQRYDIKVHETGTSTAAGPLIGLETPAS